MPLWQPKFRRMDGAVALKIEGMQQKHEQFLLNTSYIIYQMNTSLEEKNKPIVGSL